MQKPYTKFNNENKKARNSFEKDFFRLVNGSVYGKTMEHLRNGLDVRLVSKANFVSQKIFNKNLVAVHKIKEVLMLNILD